MRSPGAAIAWQLGRRHRWSLGAIAAYLLALAAIRIGVLDAGDALDPGGSFAFAFSVTIPLTISIIWLVAAFSFGLEGDVNRRASMYPARMLALPVSTRALAGWPMLYGTLAVVIVWLAAATLALRPAGVDLPLLWPALFLAAFMAWAQVLMWLPYGLGGLRAVLAVLLLMLGDVAGLVALFGLIPAGVMTAVLLPLVPLAYLCACAALERARHDVEPDWRGRTGARARAGASTSAQRPFASAAHAQRWLEWRRHGRALPALVALVLPFVLALLFIPGMDTPGTVLEVLALALLVPPFMALLAGATVRKSSPDAVDAHALSPFIATRPMTTSRLVGVTLATTIRSTLVAWALVLVAIPLGVMLAGVWPVLKGILDHLAFLIGAARTAALGALLLALLMASTWKQLVQSLCIGLTGREWLVRLSVTAAVLALVFVVPVWDWVSARDDVQGLLWSSVRWILAALVLLKMSAAVWLAPRLYDRGLLRDRTFVGGAALWTSAVLALFAVLAWLADTPDLPRYLLLLLAILLVPLARVSAAPLALAWNRHR